jgi:hypothetical protein
MVAAWAIPQTVSTSATGPTKTHRLFVIADLLAAGKLIAKEFAFGVDITGNKTRGAGKRANSGEAEILK